VYFQDNDINRLILSKRLQSGGHTVVDTMNGKEGVEMIEVDQAFDCVLMDIQ
jgi:CheY-like chemotaxis protein